MKDVILKKDLLADIEQELIDYRPEKIAPGHESWGRGYREALTALRLQVLEGMLDPTPGLEDT